MTTRATSLFSVSDREAIERAIAEAESKTSAELVVVVATRSGRYDRAEDLFGLLLALILLAGAALLWPAPRDPNSWSLGLRIGLHAGVVLVIVALGAIGGAWLATRLPALARPFVSKRHRREEVRAAGSRAFHELRVRDTSDARGVLLYVSLYEHMVWIVGDDAVDAACTQADWDAIRDTLVASLRQGRHRDGLIDAIGSAGDLLAARFPREADDTSELPDTLHLVD